MLTTYLVRLSHPVMGSLLGTLEAESIEVAQKQLLALLKDNGIPEKHISYEVTGYHTITLTGDVTLKIYRSVPVEQWIRTVSFLVPS